MHNDSATDGLQPATIDTVVLHDPMTGLPVTVLRPAYEHACRTRRPLVISLEPWHEQSPVGTAKLTPTDEIIAELIDDSPGITKAEIERLAQDRYDFIIGTDGVKNRMRSGMPLRIKGYHFDKGGYYPPKPSKK